MNGNKNDKILDNKEKPKIQKPKSQSNDNQVLLEETTYNEFQIKTKEVKPLSVIETLQQKKIINVVEDTSEDQTINDQKESKKSKKKQEAIIEEPVIPRYYDTPILEGLSNEIVEERKLAKLVNVGYVEKGKTILGIVLSNIFTFFNMLYLTITIIFVALSSYENLLFLGTIIPNLLIGIIQEIKAKKTMDKLSLLSTPTTTVVRNGEKFEIPVQEVVLDDIIFYVPGKQICTDSIVLEGYIEVNESLLTGEADSVVKSAGDQLFSGSFVVSGVAVARVDKVGKDNYIENLSKDAKVYRKPKSELLRTLNGIIKFVSAIILPLAILTYITSKTDVGLIFDKDALIRSASSILAMIPAGLFLLTSMALAVSVVKLSRSKTLVQELYCIEMLARVNVLCLDKTGTITDGTMRVCDCIEIKNHTDYTVREIVGSIMNAFQDSNPTSDALIKYFDKNKVLKATEKIAFSSKRKFSSVTFGTHGSFILGAPEFILTENYDKVSARVERFASEGYRVLVLGHTSSKVLPDDLPRNIKPMCLIVLQDHIREDAADTIEYFKQNGVDVKVISGDNPMTVAEIASRAGIDGADRYISLAGLTDDEVRETVFDYTVFGRVSPNQKKILVQTLKEYKKVVAMTGDGVNDILALKEADCSIAMASGSEAARYVSHLVLMDSNFASMPKVVQEGRRVINNVQRTSTLFLVKTIFSILLAIMYIILGSLEGSPLKMSYPFEAKNLYMIEWFALGIPAFFLALQANKDIVRGKFLPNVIKLTLPGALTVVFLHLFLNLLRLIPVFENFNGKVFTTVATIVTTTVIMKVLFQLFKPFNWIRRIVFSLMILACFLASFNLIPIMKLDLTFSEPDTSEMELIVDNDFWVLDGKATSVKATKIPKLNDNEYVTPIITKTTYNDVRYYVINDIRTDAIAHDEGSITIVIIEGYWYINDIKTIEADKQFDYVMPEIGVNNLGHWTLDGVSTQITAQTKLMITEILLTLIFVQLIYPMMASISAIFKKLKVIPS